MDRAPDGTERTSTDDGLPDGIERRLVLRLLAHWRGLRGERAFPSFAALEPAAIADIWPHCFILEPAADGSGLVVGGVGDALDALFGRPLAGRPVAEIAAGSLPFMATGYVDEVLAKRAPVSHGGTFARRDGTRLLYRSILLPMSDDGATIYGLLGAMNCRHVVDG
jgi:hypothetical protein